MPSEKMIRESIESKESNTSMNSNCELKAGESLSGSGAKSSCLFGENPFAMYTKK
jgi:hypothetical protein